MKFKLTKWINFRSAIAVFLSWYPVRRLIIFLRARSRKWNSRAKAEAQGELSSIAKLDELLVGTKSVEEFLNSPKLLDEYASAIEKYFGPERFSRPTFNHILSQLRSVISQFPELRERVWRTEQTMQFEFSSVGECLGREVDPFLWRLHWRNYQTELKKLILEEFTSRADMQKALEESSARIENYAKIQTKLSEETLSKKERMLLKVEFFKGISSDEKVRSVAAQLLLSFFLLPENRQLLHIGDGDLILYFFKDLRQNPSKVREAYPALRIAPGFLGIIRSMMPDPNALAKDLDLFPIQMIQTHSGKSVGTGGVRQANFRTMAVRPFHSIWMGIPGNDCLAGNIENSTPQRWLVGLIEGSITSVIERDGHYQGFTRCIPVADEAGRTFGSIEIWAPLMIRRVLVPNSTKKSADLKLQPIFDIWFPRFLAGLPSPWLGLVISDSKLIDNFGIKQVITQSQYYQNSVVLGSSSAFKTKDAVVERIGQALSKAAVASSYGPGLIYDAKIRDAGDLRLLLSRAEEQVA